MTIQSLLDSLDFPGIISSIAPAPNSRKVFAAGSYLGTVGMYSTETGDLLSFLDGHIGGVTQVLYTCIRVLLQTFLAQQSSVRCNASNCPCVDVCLLARYLFQRTGIFFIRAPARTLPLSAGTLGSRVLHCIH